MEKSKPPEGIERCAVCGEFNGATEARNLTWSYSLRPEPTEIVTVSCLCKGTPCTLCKKNLVHRSISNSYVEESNSIEHSAWFAGMIPCGPCRALETSKKIATATLPIATKEVRKEPRLPDKLQPQGHGVAAGIARSFVRSLVIVFFVYGLGGILRSCSEPVHGDRPVTGQANQITRA